MRPLGELAPAVNASGCAPRSQRLKAARGRALWRCWSSAAPRRRWGVRGVSQSRRGPLRAARLAQPGRVYVVRLWASSTARSRRWSRPSVRSLIQAAMGAYC